VKIQLTEFVGPLYWILSYIAFVATKRYRETVVTRRLVAVSRDVGGANQSVIYYCRGVALTSGFYQRRRRRPSARDRRRQQHQQQQQQGKPRSGGTVSNTSHGHPSPILLRA